MRKLIGLGLLGAALAACGGQPPSEDVGVAALAGDTIGSDHLGSGVVTSGPPIASACYQEAYTGADNTYNVNTIHYPITNCTLNIAKGASWATNPPNNTPDVLRGTLNAAPWHCNLGQMVGVNGSTSNNTDGYFDGLEGTSTPDRLVANGETIAGNIGVSGTCLYDGQSTVYNIERTMFQTRNNVGNQDLYPTTSTWNGGWLEVVIPTAGFNTRLLFEYIDTSR
jgi:hypothetical protein